MNSSNSTNVNKNGKKPLILLFSERERIRDILTVGLRQCNYRIVQATTTFITIIKANQFAPDLIIADISKDHLKDLFMVNRLRRMQRTEKISMLAIIPKEAKKQAATVIENINSKEKAGDNMLVQSIEFPFNFSDLLKKIDKILNFDRAPQEKEKLQEIVKGRENSRVAKELFDSSVSITQKIEQIAAILNHKQWGFPFTVIKALDIIGSEESCCRELSNCIKSDESASSSLLKVANTVFYAKRFKRVTDINEAVVRMGFNQTRNLLSCLALIDLSKEVHTNSGFTRMEFWLHSLAVALIAQKLCERSGYKRPELAFFAGLIHDLGKIPLDNNFEGVFPKLLEEATERIDSFYETEFRMMNLTHADIGHFLGNQWNFPASITLAILNHHRPERIMSTTSMSDRALQESVFIANLCAKSMNMGHSCDEALQEIPKPMLQEMNIETGLSDRFFTDIIRKINQFRQYLNIEIRDLTLVEQRPFVSDEEIFFVHGHHAPFHPLTMALTHYGYNVRTEKMLTEDITNQARAIIIMPEPGRPLDVMLYDEDKGGEEHNKQLKIFIVDMEPEQNSGNGISDSDIYFINQKQLDLRVVLHIIDKFMSSLESGQTETENK